MNLIILFSGQGLQSQRHIEEVLTATSEHEKSLLKKVMPELFANDFNMDVLFNNSIAQPFIYTLQYHRWQQLQQLIKKPTAFAGYSLGEIDAFCCSCQLDFETGLTLINYRAKFMEEEVSEASGLLAIQGLHHSELDNLLSETNTHLSIKINEDQFIIGGYTNHLSQAEKLAHSLGAQNTQLLKVSVPSHTQMMQHAAEKFSEYTNSVTSPPMQIPIISATNGIKYSDSNQGLGILSSQIDHALDWYSCMENIEEYQPSMIIEMGSGNALSKMINNLMPHVPCRSWDDFRTVKGLNDWILKNS